MVACSRLSVVGREKRESERKNKGELTRYCFRLSPTTESLEQAIEMDGSEEMMVNWLKPSQPLAAFPDRPKGLYHVVL